MPEQAPVEQSTAEAALAALLAAMSTMKDEDRMGIFTRLQDLYCTQCGSDYGWHCTCMRDE